MVEKLAYAWVELCYARQSEQFDTPWVEGEYDDEWGMVDKLAVSTQSCIHDQEHQRVVVADCEITMRVDKVGKEEVQLTHGYINVVRVDAQVGMQTIRRLLQPFTIRRFKWYCFEQDYLDQVESPNLMKQNEKCSFETFIRKKK